MAAVLACGDLAYLSFFARSRRRPPLLDVVDRSHGHPGVGALRAILQRGAAPTRSMLEDRLLDLLDSAGIERPEVNAPPRFGGTTISVAPRVETAAPAASPATFPGVTSIAEGSRLPPGWVVVSRDVRIARGDEVAFAALRLTCPKGKTWRSGAASDDIGVSVLDRSARGKRSVLVMATFSTAIVRPGETAAGTAFALCR